MLSSLKACSRLKDIRTSGSSGKSRAKTAFGLGSCWEVVLTESRAKAGLLVTQKGLGERRGRQDDCVALGKRERVVSTSILTAVMHEYVETTKLLFSQT